MIRQVVEVLKDNKIKKIVTCNDILEKIDEKIRTQLEKTFEVEIVDDVRSATFFSLGETNIENEPIILLIDGRYLPSVYTGITEAWFQRKTIVVLALYEKYSDINCEYLKRCTSDVITFYNEEENDYNKKIKDIINKKYPAIINLKVEFNNSNKLNDNNILEIAKILNSEDEMWIYNLEMTENNTCKIKNIDEAHKYGILSKYMGYITAKNEKVLLVSTSEILKLDLNIFNNRYINKNFKVILVDNKNIFKENNIEKWIQENKIKLTHVKEISEDKLKDFWHSDEPEMVVIGGEE